MRELPDYLRPVPGPGDARAAAAAGRGPRRRDGGWRHPRPDPADAAAGTPAASSPTRSSSSATRPASRSTRRSLSRGPRAAGPRSFCSSRGRSTRSSSRGRPPSATGSTTSTSSLFNVDMGAANLVSAKSARRHQALPVAFIDESTLLLAMADPTNLLGAGRRPDGDRPELRGRGRVRPATSRRWSPSSARCRAPSPTRSRRTRQRRRRHPRRRPPRSPTCAPRPRTAR